MKSLLIGMGVMLIGLIIFSYAEVWGADWELLQKIDVTHSPPKIVKVWVKQVYTEKDKGMISLVGLRYQNFSYSINSLQFDCGERTTRFLSITYHSENGDLLRLGDPSDKWESIPPNSMFDALYKIVCK